MSNGLFLNFVEFMLSSQGFNVQSLQYRDFEELRSLRATHLDKDFWKGPDNKIYFWQKSTQNRPLRGSEELVFASENPKLFQRIFYSLLQSKLSPALRKFYRIGYARKTHWWTLTSLSDLLEDRIPGLCLYKQATISPYYTFNSTTPTFGCLISFRIKHCFSYNSIDFEANGIDPTGIKFIDGRAIADKKSLEYFLKVTGLKDPYKQILDHNYSLAALYQDTSNLVGLFRRLEGKTLISDCIVQKVKSRLIPHSDMKSILLEKPTRYYWNLTTPETRTYYDAEVRSLRPFSYDTFLRKPFCPLKISVLTPASGEGAVETFIKKLEQVLKVTFHLEEIEWNITSIQNESLKSYLNPLYDKNFSDCHLAIVVTTEAQKSISIERSPYYCCKAKLLGQGIPSQEILLETIWSLNPSKINNLALNIYAKIGGTAWVIQKEEKITPEIVVGVGATTFENQTSIGIAQIFLADGQYLVGNCFPVSNFDDYALHLEESLSEALETVVREHFGKERFRLIFHLYKPAGKSREIQAIENVIQKLNRYSFRYALLHLGEEHNFRLFYNKGQSTVRPGTLVNLSPNSALVHYSEKSCVPLKIDLDHRSTFKDLSYLAKQVYWFSHLSHRTFKPAKSTVTISYPSEMAYLYERLKKVPSWDDSHLMYIQDKLWFL